MITVVVPLAAALVLELVEDDVNGIVLEVAVVEALVSEAVLEPVVVEVSGIVLLELDVVVVDALVSEFVLEAVVVDVNGMVDVVVVVDAFVSEIAVEVDSVVDSLVAALLLELDVVVSIPSILKLSDLKHVPDPNTGLVHNNALYSPPGLGVWAKGLIVQYGLSTPLSLVMHVYDPPSSVLPLGSVTNAKYGVFGDRPLPASNTYCWSM